MSIKGSIGEQNVVYFYNRISRPKKEGQSHTCYHMDEP